MNTSVLEAVDFRAASAASASALPLPLPPKRSYFISSYPTHLFGSGWQNQPFPLPLPKPCYLDSFLDLQPSLFLIGCRPDQWRGFLITVSQLGLVSSSSSPVSSSSSPPLGSFITSCNSLSNYLGSQLVSFTNPFSKNHCPVPAVVYSLIRLISNLARLS